MRDSYTRVFVDCFVWCCLCVCVFMNFLSCKDGGVNQANTLWNQTYVRSMCKCLWVRVCTCTCTCPVASVQCHILWRSTKEQYTTEIWCCRQPNLSVCVMFLKGWGWSTCSIYYVFFLGGGGELTRAIWMNDLCSSYQRFLHKSPEQGLNLSRS